MTLIGLKALSYFLPIKSMWVSRIMELKLLQETS